MSAFTTWKNRLERIEEKLAQAEDDVAEFEATLPKPKFGGKAIYYTRDVLIKKKTDTLAKLATLASRGENWRFKLTEKQDRMIALQLQLQEQESMLEETHKNIFSNSGEPDKNANAYKTYTLLLTQTRKQLALAKADLNKHELSKPPGTYETLPDELLQYATNKAKESNTVKSAPAALRSIEELARELIKNPKLHEKLDLKLKDTSVSGIMADSMPIDASEFELNITPTKEEEANESTSGSAEENSD